MKIQTFDGLEGEGQTAAEAFADLARRHALTREQAECQAQDILLGLERAEPVAPADCQHEEFGALVSVGRMLDTGKFIAEITIRCVVCGEPFRFLGVPAGLGWTHPRISIDGLELRAPIEPEGEKQLYGSALFEMPPIPTRH